MSDMPVSYAALVGVDLHKCTVSLCAVDPLGKAISALTCDTKCVEPTGHEAAANKARQKKISKRKERTAA